MATRPVHVRKASVLMLNDEGRLFEVVVGAGAFEKVSREAFDVTAS